MQIEQKKIQELINRYWLEPAIRDVFVEGRCDASVIARFLRFQNIRDVRVYEISSVEISERLIVESGLHEGNRGRVIFLAREFEKSLPNDSKAGTCIADRDYDTILERAYASSFLLFVDHCCMEMYSFDADLLDGLFESLVPSLSKRGQVVLEELELILHSLFAIRATNIALRLNLKWLESFEDSCTLTGNGIEFDEENFITRYLGKNARLQDKAKFLKKFHELRSKIQGDPRLFVRGHDFSNVLAWYLREHSSISSPFLRKEVLEKFLIAFINLGQLTSSLFFHELTARLQA